MNELSSREISIQRAQELKTRIESYITESKNIKTGFTNQDNINTQKRKIMELLNCSDEEWNDWKWQLKNCINDVDVIGKIINLSEDEKSEIKQVQDKYRWSISPYYLSLMDKESECAIRKQAIPQIYELDECGKSDPMSEEFTSPLEGITRRYPDRLIINVTNLCASFCRHCQRRRNIGGVDVALSREKLKACFDYVKNNPEIRDVLVTGGDPLTLPDDLIIWILTSLRKIESVEIIRIGTRTLVNMPQRITDELCEKLSKLKPLYINTQFNSPLEITQDVLEACDKLIKAGVIIGNQSVLLKFINDDTNILKKLNHELLKVRIRPYYIFHPKDVVGTRHFYVKVKDGIEIVGKLRGETSGLAIPTYILNAPNGKGKIPLGLNNILSINDEIIKLRTWEGDIVEYKEM